MKTIRFYADENFPLAIIEELRQLDYDVLTSTEAGQANQSISDENVLKLAQEKIKLLLLLIEKVLFLYTNKIKLIAALLFVKKIEITKDQSKQLMNLSHKTIDLCRVD